MSDHAPFRTKDALYPPLPDVGPTTAPPTEEGDCTAWAAATIRKQQTSFESLRAKLRAPSTKTTLPLETYPTAPSKRTYTASAEEDDDGPTMEQLSGTPCLSAAERSADAPRTGITPEFSKISVKQPPLARGPVKVPKLRSQPTSTWSLNSPLNPPSAESAYLDLVPRNPYQAYLNNHISFYVQWELERQLLIAGLSWEHVRFEDLELVRGDAITAFPSIPSVMKKVVDRGAGQVRVSDLSAIPTRVMIEIDREERSILAQDLMGVHNDSRDWPYGGRLMLAADLEYCLDPKSPPHATDCSDSNPFAPVWPFNVNLQPVEMPGRSNRLARRFGSRRLLYLRFGTVPRQQRGLVLGLFRGHGLVLLGRVYRVLYIPPDSDTAVAVQVDEEAPGAPLLKEPKVLSFLQLLGCEFYPLDQANVLSLQ